MHFFNNRVPIARKLLLLVLVASTIATTVTSLMQIIFEYRFALNTQNSQIEVFQTSAIPGLRNSFWNYNEEALNDQIRSSLTTIDFIKIEVFDDKGHLAASSDKGTPVSSSIEKIFPLEDPTNSKNILGKVVLTYTNDNIIQNLWQKAIWILVFNFIKTFIVSFFLLKAFNYFIVTRLNSMASAFKNKDWLQPVDLKTKQLWPFQNTSDEVSDIEGALSEASLIIANNANALKESALSSARLAELGIFASGVAHEVNNPLTIISGFMSTIERHYKNGTLTDESFYKTSDRINAAALRIKKIISALGSLSRDGSKDPFEINPVKKILNDTLSLCEHTLAKKDIKLSYKITPSDLEINCRPVQLSQILLNLINNSADAIAENTERWIELEFKIDNSNQNIICTLTDSGHGIPAEVREKIFVPFYTTKPVGKGTGLGLAIVHNMIDQHSGQISINENSPNTQFIIKFPMRKQQNAA